MGFSPAQARAALAKTTSGVDVQAALDGLLGEAFGTRQPEPAGELDEDDEYIERERIRRENEEKEEKRRRRRQGPSRNTIAPRSRDERERERSQAGTPQAEILAQATEIGQSVFTKATSLWNTGKEKALKAYEEQKRVYEAQLAAGGGGGTREKGRAPVKDGRPTWMVEAEAGGEEIGGAGAAVEKESGFRDDSDEEEEIPRPRARTNGNGAGNGAGASRPSRGQDRPVNPAMEESLFGDDPLPSRPTQRRPEPPRPKARPTPAARTATPPAPLPARTLVPADPSAIQSSSSHKTKGNEHFKLGRFTEAESSYSTAISILPDGHLHLIPLYNNRAATRIKLGESSGAAQDSSYVIEIIGHSYHPSKEAPLPSTMSEIKLADSFVKAYTKRAQAWEMGEKWNKAVEDWEKVLGFDSAMLGGSALQTRNLAAEGLRRSKQMLDGPTPSTSTSTLSTSRPTPKPPKPIRSKPAQVERSEAVSTLRAAAKVQDQEDQQRLQLKDVTEARINTWKAGKETNLRALLASLDTVLWDEVLAGGLKVGMHELITEKQVKIKYMKVIARLHPDKVGFTKNSGKRRELMIA
jgi:tetratricopeptide (TPR) repeat protein